MTVLFKNNPDVATGNINFESVEEFKEYMNKHNPEILTVEEFVKNNIYNKGSLSYCFAKYSPLNQEQKETLKQYLLNFKNGDIKGYNYNLEKWVRNMKYEITL